MWQGVRSVWKAYHIELLSDSAGNLMWLTELLSGSAGNNPMWLTELFQWVMI